MTETNFYQNLEAFKSFEEITSDEHYETVPGNWNLLVTDIRNSTEAIENGQYRDVNKIGAASITVVREELGGLEFPFIFGGDGAILIVPPAYQTPAAENLLGLKQLAMDNFGLELRVGQMEVSEVLKKNVNLEVAKLELTTGRCIAIFRGGAMTRAEELTKQDYSSYKIEGNPNKNIELTGLSCRWKPIPSKQGNILSLLIQARETPPDQIYDSVLRKIDDILEGGLGEANPINQSDMNYKTVWESLKDEVRYHTTILSISFINRFLEILLAVAVFKFNLHPYFFDPHSYFKQLRTHSDYRKFDDMLRLILDCTDEEKNEIESFLESMVNSEKIFHGLQNADESLMTCYVEELDQGGHLHFIDGGDGGYARAAKQLKQQIRTATENS